MLQEVLDDQDSVVCPRRGYALKWLEAENGEIKCPECGRHTPHELLH